MLRFHVSVIGVDETSEAKGHNYISLFVDLKEKNTIFIADDKDKETVSDFKEDFEVHKGKVRGYKTKHFKTIAYLITADLDFGFMNENLKSTQNS